MTKKTLLWAIASVIALSFTTVGVYTFAVGKDYTPDEAVEQFYAAAKKGEIDEAKKYVATEVLEFYDTRSNSFTGTISYGITEEGKKYDYVKPTDTTIKGDTATVKVKVKRGEYKTDEEMLLVKEEDGWKLTFQ
jgi:hypothetical protein